MIPKFLGNEKWLQPMNKTEQNGKSLEWWIWDAACSIRGARRRVEIQGVHPSAIFTKRLCDVFDDEMNRIARKSGREPRRSNW